MADELDLIRQSAFAKRVNGVSGGNRIIWGEKDLVRLYDRYVSARREEFLSDEPVVAKYSGAALPDKAGLAKAGIELRDFAPDDSAFLCLLTNATIDHAGDSVNVGGVDTSLFEKNAPVLDSHDSSKAPIASSSRPFLSGSNMLGIARFPKQGVSANSDQIAAAIRAKLVRGVSIGFIPLSWEFSKDPARKLGVNFNAVKLLEYSTCALPMNPDCRVLGSVANNQSTPADGKAVADRRREARELAAEARRVLAASTPDRPLTREQRIAEAAALRRSMGC